MLTTENFTILNELINIASIEELEQKIAPSASAVITD
jgi:hypothetical protein